MAAVLLRNKVMEYCAVTRTTEGDDVCTSSSEVKLDCITRAHEILVRPPTLELRISWTRTQSHSQELLPSARTQQGSLRNATKYALRHAVFDGHNASLKPVYWAHMLRKVGVPCVYTLL